MKKNILYAQSGGVTPVINATACGVIETARENSDRIGKVYAGKDGIIGVLREELIDTSKELKSSISALRHTPGGAFGSCRYKLKGIDENQREYERLIEVFRAHDIGYFLYNGGGDSSDTAHKVSQIGRTMGFPVQCIGVPKTIDNDLPATDNCPGEVTIDANPPSGGFFPNGTTEVTATATDAAGNIAQCTFFVTIEASCYDRLSDVNCDGQTDALDLAMIIDIIYAGAPEAPPCSSGPQ